MNYPNASKHSDKYNNTGLFNYTHDDDHDTEVKARMLSKKDFDHKLKNDDDNMFNSMDARTSDIERHIRRQKKYKHESTIFDFDLK